MEEENKINPNNDDNTDNSLENSMFSNNSGASMFDEIPSEIEAQDNIIDVEEVAKEPSETVEEVVEETIEEPMEEKAAIEPTVTIEETSTSNTSAKTDNLITVRPVKFEEFKDNNVNRSIKRRIYFCSRV